MSDEFSSEYVACSDTGTGTAYTELIGELKREMMQGRSFFLLIVFRVVCIELN